MFYQVVITAGDGPFQQTKGDVLVSTKLLGGLLYNYEYIFMKLYLNIYIEYIS